MRTRAGVIAMGLLAAGLVVVAPSGCKNKAKEMSRYPYFVRMMDDRWEIALGTIRSGQTNIHYCPVLLKDLTGMAETMEVSYNGPNRDQAIAGIRDIAKTFRDDLGSQVDMTHGSVVLLSGVTAEQVGATIDKAHAKYVEIRKLIQVEQ